jgi:tRNA (adenine22-N1)-methyltransferase
MIVYDIGCDHGLLGLSFTSKELVEEIHLVDASEAVIAVLKTKLKDSYITRPSLIISKVDGQELEIKDDKKKIIFIAGMGGKEIQKILQAFATQLNPDDSIVISPHRKILELRHYLHFSPFRLRREMSLCENNQYYQILHLGLSGSKAVSFFGEDIWKGEIGEGYRLHQIRHFLQHQDSRSQDYVSFLKNLSY